MNLVESSTWRSEDSVASLNFDSVSATPTFLNNTDNELQISCSFLLEYLHNMCVSSQQLYNVALYGKGGVSLETDAERMR